MTVVNTVSVLQWRPQLVCANTSLLKAAIDGPFFVLALQMRPIPDGKTYLLFSFASIQFDLLRSVIISNNCLFTMIANLNIQLLDSLNLRIT